MKKLNIDTKLFDENLLYDLCNRYLSIVMIWTQMLREKSRSVFWISVALVLALMPVLQIIPMDFMQLQTASAEGSIVLNGTKTTSGTAVTPFFQITLSNFNVGTNNNRLLVVGVESSHNSVSSITFNGTSLTKAVSSFEHNNAELWYLKNPNGTGNIVVTMNGVASVVVGAYSIFGVDQTNPIPTTAQNNSTAGSPTVTITTQYADSWVIDSASIFGGKSLSNPTCTERWNINGVGGPIPASITGASSSKIQTSAGSVTCSWTASGSDFWDSVAIELKSAASTPNAPTNPTSTAVSTSQIRLSWTAPSDNGGSVITGYKIQRASSSWVDVINNTGNTFTNYNVTGLAANSVDIYRIAAWNGVGLGTFSANVTGITIPGVPTNLIATNVSSSQINLSWTTPSGNATITGYKIERSLNSGSTWATIVPNTESTGTTYSDTGLAASTTYMYRVSAINSGGTGSTSNTASAATNTPQFGRYSSTGILMPLYVYPYDDSTACPPDGFCWQSVNETKNTYPDVPLFIVANPPENGPCVPSNCVVDTNYQRAIANLTKSGIVVLGYVSTQWNNGAVTFDEAKNNVTTWVDFYGSGNSTMGNLGIKGIFFDEMSTDSSPENLEYYQNLTDFVHVNKSLAHSFGNPGTEVTRNFIGTVDNMVIYEDFNLPDNGTLQGTTAGGDTDKWHTLFDKKNFSFVSKSVNTDPGQAAIQGRSVYVNYLYVTNACLPFEYQCISNYLSNHIGHLNSTSVLSSITAKDKSTGGLLNINNFTIYQSNNLVRNGTTPFSYNATSGWQFNFIAPQTPPSYTFCNWTYQGTNTTNNSILVAPTENANYIATYSSSTC